MEVTLGVSYMSYVLRVQKVNGVRTWVVCTEGREGGVERGASK
jgi:hypothetical protein